MPETSEPIPVIVVCGPTGAGKTAVAIELARRFNGEVIGADSMQVYRAMDIGTATPTAAEQAAAVHHMINVVDPDGDFDAAAYAGMAAPMIRSLAANGVRAIVAGGTGLYIKALIHGLSDAAPADPRHRRRLREEAAQHGAEALHRRLAAVDPVAAGRIHPRDTVRVIRALEVFESAGEPISAIQARHRFRPRRGFNAHKIGLSWPREILYDRINRRVDMMIDAGLLEEVRGLLAQGYAPTLKSMQSIGYRHMIDYLQGRMPWEEAVDTLKRDTRRYAKRQMTWFRADDDIHWFTPDDVDGIHRSVSQFLSGTGGG